MKDFAAIDFETANEYRSSVCRVGVVIVRDGQDSGQVLQPYPSVSGLLLVLEHAGTRVNGGFYNDGIGFS